MCYEPADDYDDEPDVTIECDKCEKSISFYHSSYYDINILTAHNRELGHTVYVHFLCRECLNELAKNSDFKVFEHIQIPINHPINLCNGVHIFHEDNLVLDIK